VFVRTLLLTVAIGASLAIAGVAAAPAKDGLKVSFTLAPTPPLTQTLIAMNCTEVAEGRQVTYECHNTGGPNPFPPKDTKSVTFTFPGGTDTVTAYPDGQVTDNGTFKLSKECPSLLACL
jgi:hypothetical protein